MKALTWGKGNFLKSDILVAFEGNNVCALYISGDEAQFLADFPQLAAGSRNDATAADIAERILDGETTISPKFLKASPLEKAVWGALLQIPRGTTCTYTEIAQSIGRPKAVRAVASAVGRNPISILVPCHRVVRLDGTLGGYRWGLDVKRSLLEHERRAKA